MLCDLLMDESQLQNRKNYQMTEFKRGVEPRFRTINRPDGDRTVVVRMITGEEEMVLQRLV